MKVAIADDVVFRDLGGEAVILSLHTSTYFGLNEIGTRIWHLIGEHGSMERVVAALLNEYEVDEARLRQDVDRLIRQLHDKGLVRTERDDGPTVG
jgi:hypothetical protein